MTRLLTLLLIITAVFSSCKKDEDEGKMPTCQLTSLMIDGTLYQITEGPDGILDYTSNTDSGVITYDSEGRIATVTTYYEGELDMVEEYYYLNGDDNVTEIVGTDYYSGASYDSDTFRYSYQNGYLHRVDIPSSPSPRAEVYTFNSKGNITRMEDYETDWQGQEVLYRVTIFTYNDAPNPFPSVLVDPMYGKSKNLMASYEETRFYDNGVSIDTSTWLTTFTYQANADGYVTQLTETDSYGDSFLFNLTYDCK